MQGYSFKYIINHSGVPIESCVSSLYHQMKRSLLILEILLLFACAVITALGWFPLPVVLFFIVAWISLHWRGLRWRDVGLRRPENWLATVGLALVIGVGYQLLDTLLIGPLLEQLTRQPIDLSQFTPIQSNLALLLGSLLLTWTEAAFIEEMFFRGYLFNRLTDLFGNHRLGIGLALLISSLVFSLAHGYQGLTGILDTFLAGIFLGLLYLATRRNLWLPILTHGIIDTLAFLLIYLGFVQS
jgi:membrane protease YdiL (CAAX protease family)